jgi:hypothetical protein
LRGSVIDRFMRLVPGVDVLVVGTPPEDDRESEASHGGSASGESPRSRKDPS